ncbi:hypothetical protein FHG66_17880 [Rubellimicrobium rubrum]|uniref:asparagine synthase (glutamine-hydrolyzing) n=1 Tax=Rubellimicrobium rubrum TaxID=2585369 RepID=A0A5C4MM51_9RHOB|nr:asparagine synthase-related protein [Rubellimicrobium rubrum]TNC46862.1 hypothetical protein FHG66_17880 [Rubellimicrobium rubrum]
MSGICGILRLDGGPPDGIEAMAALLERRGPNATRIHREGQVALGHTLLATTPEARHEVMPLTDPATGCTITADVRLDNRAELLAALDLLGTGRVIGDGEIILRAWLAWGEGCLTRLLGDFAFAIWDPRAEQIIAARDPMGMRQLAYAHRENRLLAFATEPRAVLEAQGVPPDLDTGRIADYLEDYLEAIDVESTFFQHVRRLPPAHWLVADARGLTVRRYWSLVPGPEMRLGSDQAYADAFLDVFTEAVRCRLRSDGPVGSMLSGGLDSGSAVAVATRLLAAEGRGPLPTFSVIHSADPDCAETRAIRASLTIPGLDPHLVDVADLSPYMDDLHEALRSLKEPFDGQMNLVRSAYIAAERAGVRVVLDGVAGDIVLTDGNRMGQLIRAGRWTTAWNEAVAEERYWSGEHTRWRFMGEALRQAAVPDWLRRARRRWSGLDDARPKGALLHPDFARQVDLRSRVARWRRNSFAPAPSQAAWRAASISGPVLLVGRERYDRVAAGHGIEPRDPFMDLRVIEFCLRCPSSQMKTDGWPKVLLRRALRGLLPEEVLWRAGRTHLGWTLTQLLIRSADKHGAMPGPSDTTATLLNQALNLPYGQPLSRPLVDDLRWDRTVLALWSNSAYGPKP